MQTSDTIAIAAAFLSLVAVALSGVSLYYSTLKPAKILAAFNAVALTRNGGPHLSIPVSITNEGARAVTIHGVKLRESDGEKQSLYVAGLTTTPEQGVDPLFGPPGGASALFVPFVVRGGTEVHKVLIMAPLAGPNIAGDFLAASGKRLLYNLVLGTSIGDISTQKSVLWREPLDQMLAHGHGFMQPTDDAGIWQETVL